MTNDVLVEVGMGVGPVGMGVVDIPQNRGGMDYEE